MQSQNSLPRHITDFERSFNDINQASYSKNIQETYSFLNIHKSNPMYGFDCCKLQSLLSIIIYMQAPLGIVDKKGK